VAIRRSFRSFRNALLAVQIFSPMDSLPSLRSTFPGIPEQPSHMAQFA
jgi:hypothetical protein